MCSVYKCGLGTLKHLLSFARMCLGEMRVVNSVLVVRC